ncbi:hypothetical protein OHB26_19000 [Nocardia sp. NBC_01503]|uniref:hypothetical protein n=1 Tax=Nocardia sp. NBC_01503 TaxID=2975997 RepID=UPI002E7BB8A2|nr:hypothetical protein [Nocardia sp. NBC_01503]WTL29112.1 hypothetical protein OHB26_19000 [Nocardia sp. NBC_01503]
MDAQELRHLNQKRVYRWSDIEILKDGGRIWLKPDGQPKRKWMTMEWLIPNVVLIPLLHDELSGRG